jgi:nucleotide-binding universal stress UspA family protein
LVLGSVAEKVLRLATCPVLTVRSGARAARRRRSLFGTIQCATDFSVAANRAVAYAKRLAKEANAKLVVMHAVDWPFGDAVASRALADLRKSLQSNARDGLVRLLPGSSSSGPGAEAVVTIGKASVGIIRLARARAVDLIVMGVSGGGATNVALLGSTTHQVIREGMWPVLTVRTVKR